MIAEHRVSGDSKSRAVPQGPKCDCTNRAQPHRIQAGQGGDRNGLCWQPSNRQTGQCLGHPGVQFVTAICMILYFNLNSRLGCLRSLSFTKSDVVNFRKVRYFSLV